MHVITLSRRENITVEVVPFIQHRGAADIVLYPFTYLRIPAEGIVDPFEYVHIGAPDGRCYLNHPDAVQIYSQHFAGAAEAAIDGDDARRFLLEISREYR